MSSLVQKRSSLLSQTLTLRRHFVTRLFSPSFPETQTCNPSTSNRKYPIHGSGYDFLRKNFTGSSLSSVGNSKLSYGSDLGLFNSIHFRLFSSQVAVEPSTSDGLTVEGIIANQWPILEESESDWKSHASAIAQSIHLIKKRLQSLSLSQNPMEALKFVWGLEGLIWYNGVVVMMMMMIIVNINGSVEASHKVYREYQSLPPPLELNHIHRTGFHFQPKHHWINDPNGPMYYQGIYHLFYQYNPKGAVWGNIVWAHSVSTDMINWKSLDLAIYPSKLFDQYGCWSGSSTILPGNKPVILYTGIIDKNNTQVQNYAVPANYSDPYLQEWIKPNNNPLVFPGIGINKTEFRDPTTAWWDKDGHWRILVGSKRKSRGMVYLFRSRDFLKWIKAQHPLHSKAKTGMWECPDFYPVSMDSEFGLETSAIEGNIKHVLKVSLDETRFEYYTIGTYFREKDRYVPDNTSIDGRNGLRYDYGNFYASKTFFDASKNRRILLGWSNESDTPTEDVKKGWAGIQTIPRKVWLDTSGKQLVQWPIKELETLRREEVHLSDHKLNLGDYFEIKGITAIQADVEVIFSFPSLDKAEPFDPSWVHMDAQTLCSHNGSTVQGGVGPFGLLTLASKHLEQYTPIFFRVFKATNKHFVLMCSDATSSSLKKEVYKPSYASFVDADLTDKKLSLRSLIDHSVVESFGAQGKTCITSRVYPSRAVLMDAHLYAFNNGTETITIENLNAWSLANPQMN